MRDWVYTPARTMRGWLVSRVSTRETHLIAKEIPMAKRGRKKRSRKHNAANHGKRPNS